MSNLAIVIPAFKNNFFYESLESIANQTNKAFTLYIGDDCSPGLLEPVVRQFEGKVDIIYKKFDNNFGARDLIAQWERCIDLTNDEEWIWLFSDDDVMEPSCVENFYRTIDKFPDFDLYHFNVNKIDEKGLPTSSQFRHFPEVLTSEEFLLNKLQPGYYSTVVEYIFRKSHFFKKGRFEKFDLAWCSDDATWIKLGKRRGIRTIEDSRVYWRESQVNISSIVLDSDIFKRKLAAQTDFAGWLYRLAIEKRINISFHSLRSHLRTWFFMSMKYGIKSLDFGNIPGLLINFDRALDGKKPYGSGVSFLVFYKIYRSLVDSIKKLFPGLNLRNPFNPVSSI